MIFLPTLKKVAGEGLKIFKLLKIKVISHRRTLGKHQFFTACLVLIQTFNEKRGLEDDAGVN